LFAQFCIIDCQMSPLLEKLKKIFEDGDGKDLSQIRKDLINLLDSEKIDGMPVPLDLAKALVNTVDLKDFLGNKGVDFVAIATAALTGGNIVEAVIKAIKFDILQRSMDIPAFFRQTNITEMVRKAGIRPDLLEAFLINVDFKEFVGAIQLAKVLELYSPTNNASDKLQELLKLVDAKEVIASINWKGLQHNQNMLNYLDLLPLPANVDGRLMKAVIQSINLEIVAKKSVDVDGVIRDVLQNNSSIASAITQNLNITIIISSLNTTLLLGQPNITEILESNNIDPRLVKVLRHVDMEMFSESANLGEIIIVYYKGDNTTRNTRLRQVLDKIDNEGLRKSVKWNDLKDDRDFQGLVRKYVPTQYVQVVLTSDLEQLVAVTNLKALAIEMLTAPTTLDVYLSIILSKYLMSERVLKALDLGAVIQSYLNTTTQMYLSQSCQDQLVEMAFPLPSFDNINLNGLEGLKAIQHPLIQRKYKITPFTDDRKMPACTLKL